MNISKYFSELITEANAINITDIHFKPSNEYVEVYFRKTPELILINQIELNDYQKLINYLKFKANLDISLKKLPQDGALSWENINIRLSFVPLIKNESIVIRIIPPQIINNYSELFFNQKQYQEIYQLLSSEVGLFVFTGPTGCGKTTSMYKLLSDLVANQHKKVITVEDPIEIQNNLFVQMQIDSQKGFTYAKALKAILRQDPDIIMVGEIRDIETAKIVMQAALTGHLIITTMHTKNKRGVYERLLDFGFKKSEITSVLVGVCNQRLLVKGNERKVFLDIAIKKELDSLYDEDSEINLEAKMEYLFPEK